MGDDNVVFSAFKSNAWSFTCLNISWLKRKQLQNQTFFFFFFSLHKVALL